ncbi:DUF4276 family protein [Pseudomonas sp. ODNR1LW]|nr:DUF4276 family protein [Pseudomonas sp. ODNR1LW]
MNLIFMLEEPSMRYFIDGFIRRVLPEGVNVQYLVHEGKQDLDKSIPRKLKAWKIPNSYFVIVRDKDAEDPLKLKKRLSDMCVANDRPDTLIRIAVHHLESWVLGDFNAVALAFNKPNLKALSANRKYRNPDMLANASEEVSRLIPGYQKVNGAREVSKYIDPNNNSSSSFNVFVSGVRSLVANYHV